MAQAASARTSSHRRPAAADQKTRAPRDSDRFFDLSVDLLCVAGVDGYFKRLNPMWTATLGHSDEELLSRPYLDLVHPDDIEGTIAEADKLAHGFKTVHFRNRYRCKDGSYKWLAWTATPAMADGMIYASARDVSHLALDEERQAEVFRHQRVRIQSMVDANGVTMVFQPIFNLQSRDVCGMEALSRFAVKPIRPPDVWFEEAGAVGLRAALEMLAVKQAVGFADHLPPGSFMSINASPATIVGENFLSLLYALPGERLVLEVTENAAVEDYQQLKQAIEPLRKCGVRLAIDDAGAGFSSLKHVVQLAPDFIKLDLFLTRDIDTDPVKRSLARALANFCTDIGAVLIAEGIETAAELKMLQELGVGEGQGFFLGRPAPI